MKSLSNQKGFAHFMVLFIALIGIGVLTWMVTTQSFDIRNRAATSEEDCRRKKPTLEVQPSSAEGEAGDELIYQVVITNNDEPTCGPTLFNFSFDFDTNLVPVQIPGSIVSNPQDDVWMSLILSSPSNLALGRYSNQVNIASDVDSIHSAKKQFVYKVVEQAPPQEPPPDVNNDPVIVTTVLSSATVGEDYFAEVFASDADNDQLELVVQDLPDGMRAENCRNTGGDTNQAICDIVGVPTKAKNYNVTVTATDPQGASTTARLQLRVLKGGIFSFLD